MGDVILLSSESSDEESILNTNLKGLEFPSLNRVENVKSIISLEHYSCKGNYNLSSESESESQNDIMLKISLKEDNAVIDPSSTMGTDHCSEFSPKSESAAPFYSHSSGGGLSSAGNSSTAQESDRFVHILSDSDDDIDDKISSVDNVILNSHSGQSRSQVISQTQSNSSHSEDDILRPTVHLDGADKPKGVCGKRKNMGKDSSIGKKELAEKRRKEAQADRERKKNELAQAKALKQAAAKIQKVYKLEECLKYVTALLDHNLFEENFGGDLKHSLNELEVKYQSHSQIYPMTVTWIRKIPVEDGATKTNEESHVLLIMTPQQAVNLIQKRELCNEVQAVQAHFTSQKLSLILHGTESYFRVQKKGKSNDVSRITRDDLTEALVEVHILAGCNHRFTESSMEVAMMIGQFTKAVAEIPYRLEKSKKEENKLDWFGEGDNRDCVRVDKNGIGLQRLWRQQLCEFNLAGLQISEAITGIYRTPQALFQAYNGCCNRNEAEKLLQDIQIRRNVGALSSARRIGPELSKKIHAFFTSLDGTGDLSLSQS